MSKITIDFDEVSTELIILGESVEGIKGYASALYDMVAPVKMYENLPYGTIDKWTGFGNTHSCEVFDSMNSKFIKSYGKLWNGLRGNLKSNVINKFDSFYTKMTTAFAIMSAAELASENYIVQKANL